MKKFSKWLLAFLMIFMTLPLVQVNAVNNLDVHVFHSRFCRSCQELIEYLQTLEEDYNNINLIYYEIGDADNASLFDEVTSAFDQKAEVPFVTIGGLSFVGYNPQIELDLENTIIRYSAEDHVDVTQKIIDGETLLITDFDVLERSTIRLPLIGELEIESVSLFLAAVVLGFVDGFNPCAMWVLIFLITMLINMQDRKRMWIIGVTFLLTSALVYFLIMVSWLQIAISLTAVAWFRYLIGAFAVGFGTHHLIKYIKSRKEDVGCEVTDEKQRFKLIERIKHIVKKQNLWLALGGVVVLAVLVNLIELACSAGLPLLYTQILAYNQLSNSLYFLYIGVYILFFLIDDLLIFSVAVISFKVTGISNRYQKLSTFIGGLLMLLIGLLLIFFPGIIMFNF